MKSWELVEMPDLVVSPDKEGRKMALRLTAANGAWGVMPARFCRSLSDATVEILKTNNLLDHKDLYDMMVEKHVPADQLKSVDILCWDLHARMSQKPLHALLGTQRGDVATIRALWALQDKIALDLEEETAIGLKWDIVAGQERVVWNPSLCLSPKEFVLTEVELAGSSRR